MKLWPGKTPGGPLDGPPRPWSRARSLLTIGALILAVAGGTYSAVRLIGVETRVRQVERRSLCQRADAYACRDVAANILIACRPDVIARLPATVVGAGGQVVSVRAVEDAKCELVRWSMRENPGP